MAGQDPAHTQMMFLNAPVPTAWHVKWVLYSTNPVLAALAALQYLGDCKSTCGTASDFRAVAWKEGNTQDCDDVWL